MASGVCPQRKKAATNAAFGNFLVRPGVAYFGGSEVDGLVAGLAPRLEGRADPAGRDAEGAAGTPDCEL